VSATPEALSERERVALAIYARLLTDCDLPAHYPATGKPGFVSPPKETPDLLAVLAFGWADSFLRERDRQRERGTR
jgi:hypothetical protein